MPQASGSCSVMLSPTRTSSWLARRLSPRRAWTSYSSPGSRSARTAMPSSPVTGPSSKNWDMRSPNMLLCSLSAVARTLAPAAGVPLASITWTRIWPVPPSTRRRSGFSPSSSSKGGSEVLGAPFGLALSWIGPAFRWSMRQRPSSPVRRRWKGISFCCMSSKSVTMAITGTPARGRPFGSTTRAVKEAAGGSSRSPRSYSRFPGTASTWR